MLGWIYLWGCAELTPYRSSLFAAPPEPPPAVGAPLQGVAVGGYLTDHVLQPTSQSVGDEGDPGVFLPTRSAGLRLRAGGPNVEAGGHFDYADFATARASSVGVLPITTEDPILAVGGHLTAGLRREPIGFGFTLDATRITMAYAKYSYHGPDGAIGERPNVAQNRFYTLDDIGVVHPIRIRGTAAMTWFWGPLELSPALSFCPTFTNDGYSYEPTPIYEPGMVSLVPTLDLALAAPPFRIGLQAWDALGAGAVSDGLDTGMGARLLIDIAPRL
jgi:hypothetical protein